MRSVPRKGDLSHRISAGRSSSRMVAVDFPPRIAEGNNKRFGRPRNAHWTGLQGNGSALDRKFVGRIEGVTENIGERARAVGRPGGRTCNVSRPCGAWRLTGMRCRADLAEATGNALQPRSKIQDLRTKANFATERLLQTFGLRFEHHFELRRIDALACVRMLPGSVVVDRDEKAP